METTLQLALNADVVSLVSFAQRALNSVTSSPSARRRRVISQAIVNKSTVGDWIVYVPEVEGLSYAELKYLDQIVHLDWAKVLSLAMDGSGNIAEEISRALSGITFRESLFSYKSRYREDVLGVLKHRFRKFIMNISKLGDNFDELRCASERKSVLVPPFLLLFGLENLLKKSRSLRNLCLIEEENVLVAIVSLEPSPVFLSIGKCSDNGSLILHPFSASTELVDVIERSISPDGRTEESKRRKIADEEKEIGEEPNSSTFLDEILSLHSDPSFLIEQGWSYLKSFRADAECLVISHHREKFLHLQQGLRFFDACDARAVYQLREAVDGLRALGEKTLREIRSSNFMLLCSKSHRLLQDRNGVKYALIRSNLAHRTPKVSSLLKKISRQCEDQDNLSWDVLLGRESFDTLANDPRMTALAKLLTANEDRSALIQLIPAHLLQQENLRKKSHCPKVPMSIDQEFCRQAFDRMHGRATVLKWISHTESVLYNTRDCFMLSEPTNKTIRVYYKPTSLYKKELLSLSEQGFSNECGREAWACYVTLCSAFYPSIETGEMKIDEQVSECIIQEASRGLYDLAQRARSHVLDSIVREGHGWHSGKVRSSWIQSAIFKMARYAAPGVKEWICREYFSTLCCIGIEFEREVQKSSYFDLEIRSPKLGIGKLIVDSPVPACGIRTWGSLLKTVEHKKHGTMLLDTTGNFCTVKKTGTLDVLPHVERKASTEGTIGEGIFMF